MRLYSKALLGGVAAIALGGYTSGAAKAMDSTNWAWNLLISTNIYETVNIDINIDPVGKVLDEIMQIQVGDVHANSSVSNIYNWKPLEQVHFKKGQSTDYGLTVDAGYEYHAGGSGGSNYTETSSYSETHAFEDTLHGGVTTTSENGPAGFIGGAGVAFFGFSFPPPSGGISGGGVIGAIGAAATNGDASFDANLGGSSTHSGSLTETYANNYSYEHSGSGYLNGHLNVTESEITTYYTLAPALQDAVAELPKVASIATAAGNIISIETDTPVQEHSLQVVFDDVDPSCHHKRGQGEVSLQSDGEGHGCGHVNFDNAQFDLDADLGLQDAKPNLDSGNYNHDVALLLGLAAGAGLIEQADISATSSVDTIFNAQVDSTASAFGNLKSITVDTAKYDNGLVMGDISQLSVANVSADATATNIHLVNYTNLGGLTDPIAKATATAIGNVVNIKVNSSQGPSIPVTTP
jgi:hypothetical protein